MSSALILCLLTLPSTPAAELYNEGNSLYEKGDYTAAIQEYERAAEDINNAPLFYNLANSYFKAGKIGKAIIYYRRAQILAPRDADIAHNLEFVRSYRVDKMRTTPNPFAVFFTNVTHLLSLYEAQLLTTVFFAVTCIFMSLLIIHRRRVWGYAAAVSGILCVLFLLSWQTWQAETTAHHGAIVVPEVRALSGPGEDYKEILVLHDGTEVNVRERRNDYALIQIPGGLGGWIGQDAVEEIFRP